MLVFWLVFSFILGLSAGSFLNCLIWRLSHRKTLLGRSICPKCGHQLFAKDNIPLLSFLLLRGRCRYCQEKISFEYPLLEFITGILFVLVTLKNLGLLPLVFGWNMGQTFSTDLSPQNIFILKTIRDWIGVFVLLFIFVYDLKYQIIEDIVVLPALLVVFLLNIFLGFPWQRIALGILVGLVFFGSQYLLTKGKGIGLGDLRIGCFLAAFFAEPWLFLFSLFFGYIIGGAVGLILVVLKRKKWKSAMPLGPFLVLGAFLVLFT